MSIQNITANAKRINICEKNHGEDYPSLSYTYIYEIHMVYETVFNIFSLSLCLSLAVKSIVTPLCLTYEKGHLLCI